MSFSSVFVNDFVCVSVFFYAAFSVSPILPIFKRCRIRFVRFVTLVNGFYTVSVVATLSSSLNIVGGRRIDSHQCVYYVQHLVETDEYSTLRHIYKR